MLYLMTTKPSYATQLPTSQSAVDNTQGSVTQNSETVFSHRWECYVEFSYKLGASIVYSHLISYRCVSGRRLSVIPFEESKQLAVGDKVAVLSSSYQLNNRLQRPSASGQQQPSTAPHLNTTHTHPTSPPFLSVHRQTTEASKLSCSDQHSILPECFFPHSSV